MTTIISRLYSDPAAARAVADALLKEGHDADTIRVITAGANAADAMKHARLSNSAAAAYAKAMTSGQALLVAQVGFTPIGAARNALKTVGRHPSIDVGVADQDRYIREAGSMVQEGRVLTTHPLVMSNPFRKASHGHIIGTNMLSPSRKRTSAMPGGGHMSKAFWPMKLVSQQGKRSSVIPGGRLFSSMLGLPLLFGR